MIAVTLNVPTFVCPVGKSHCLCTFSYHLHRYKTHLLQHLEMPTCTRPSPRVKRHSHRTGHAECGRGRRGERTPPEDAGGDLTDAPVAARHLLLRPLQYGCRSP